MSRPFVLAVCGMAFEARLAGSSGVTTLCGQGATLAARLATAITEECRGVISYGVAGGLDPQLAPGTIVVPSSVFTRRSSWRTDAAWSRQLVQRLGNAVRSPLFATDVPLTDSVAKCDCFRRSGAVAVDMESHLAARCAAEAGLPFVALRAIADPARRSVPPSAACAVTPEGSIDLKRVLAGVARRPGEIVALARVGIDAAAARRALVDARRRLGPAFGLLDLG